MACTRLGVIPIYHDCACRIGYCDPDLLQMRTDVNSTVRRIYQEKEHILSVSNVICVCCQTAHFNATPATCIQRLHQTVGNHHRPAMSRATVLLPRCRVLLNHPDSMQNTTVAVPKLSVLSTPTLLPKMKMGGQLLLGNKRRMKPRLWIMKWNMKEPMAESKVEMGFTGCSRKTQE